MNASMTDSMTGWASVALGVVLFVLAGHVPDPPFQAVGPDLFPMLVGGAFVLTGLVLLRRKTAAATTPDSAATNAAGRIGRHGRRSVLVVTATMVLYIASCDYLGFLIAMPLLVGTLILWFDGRPLVAIGLGIGGSVTLHAFFYGLMGVPLPWGLLEPVAGQVPWS